MQGDTDDSADQIQEDVNPLSLEISDDEEGQGQQQQVHILFSLS